jgi:hypothetical protein
LRKRRTAAEEEALLKKGMILLKNGDISAARLNFENLALRGSTKGAFAKRGGNDVFVHVSELEKTGISRLAEGGPPGVVTARHRGDA